MSSPAWELLYWRGADPSPPAPFRESCYCVQCREYFGLLLVPAASARGPGVTVLATGDEPFEQRPCFCPQCHEEYPQYGILGGDATPLPDQVHVLHVGVFPPGRPRSRVVRVNGWTERRM